MNIHQQKHRLDVRGSDLSGSRFDDVNLSGAAFENVDMSNWRVNDANLSGLQIANANLAGAAITDGRYDGMTIAGVDVGEMLRAYRAQSGQGTATVVWWQKYGTVGQIAQACVALLGFLAILTQVGEIRSNNRANAARQVFLGYTELAFRNPKYSLPDYAAIKASSHEDQVQYENFVSYFLYSCEEAIVAFADKPEWMASCDYDLKPHLPFLCEKNAAEPAYLKTYSADTQQWIMASMKTASVTPPDCKLGKT